MSARFRNKYRSESHRRRGWDYANEGMYFVTFVTQKRDCNLGRVVKGEMILSDWGEIVNREWLNSFEIRNELFCDEYIIMPNHLHAILIINNDLNSGDTAGQVDTHGRAYLYRSPKSISSFMAGFKSVTNSKIDDYIDDHQLKISKYNRNNHFWQPNYHDRVIRNDDEYRRIKNYIINNPKKWDEDRMKG